MINDFELDLIVKEIIKESGIKDNNLILQKYYTKSSFIRSLENNMFYFKKPSTWEDPFEDFISKLVNEHKNALVNCFNITDNIYAMSTINKNSECDGMWRNFAEKSGVLIYIKLDRLLRSMIKYFIDKDCFSNDVYETNLDIKRQIVGSLKIRKISYFTDKKIAERFRYETKNLNTDYDSFTYEMLSIKKIEFDYENEYRLFVNQKFLKLDEIEFLPIGYFKDCIEKVILSPFSDSKFENDKKEIKLKCENIIPNVKIEKSTLYDISYFKHEHNL